LLDGNWKSGKGKAPDDLKDFCNIQKKHFKNILVKLGEFRAKFM